MKKYLRNLLLAPVLLHGLVACNKAPLAADPFGDSAVEQLQGRVAALERQVEAAEAVRSVKRLQWAYGHYSELGLWHDFADLFADSGIGHYTQGDLNREQIRTLFFEEVGQGRLGLATGRIYPHISFSPVINLDETGTQAKGRFRILAMLGGYGGNAIWFHGVYENAYVLEQGIWKLNELSNTAQVSGSFTAGLSAQSRPPLEAPTFAFHFAPEQVGRVAAVNADEIIRANVNAAASLAINNTQDSRLPALQTRLARLTDEAAITRLQHQYGYHRDRHEWDALVELFAAQGTYETGQQGVYSGKTSIRRALELIGPAGLAPGTVDEHILFQTYVSVAPDGQSAKARVDQLGLHGRQGDSAQWSQGIYENTFVKENGTWRIQSLHYYPRLITDYAKGWGVDAQPIPGPSAAYPPDAPATETYGVFPEFYIPAFHFAHPVTGRVPQYPEGDPAIGKAVGFAGVAPQSAAAQQIATEVSVLSQLAAAEVQAEQALAVDAVEHLINAYAYYLDECMPQQAAQLFADKGSNAIPGIGYYEGEERIAAAIQRAYCATGRKENTLTLHHAVQPVITVADDGSSATVQSRLWQVHVGADAGEQDYYLMGRLEGTAIRQNTGWKLQTLSTHYNWVAAVNEGWAQATRNAALDYAAPEQMLVDFPPDQQGTAARLAPYP